MKADLIHWVEETKDQSPFQLKRKRSFKSKRLEFIGWGSRPLIEFLQSIGRETNREYSQHEVNAIVLDYVNSNNLLNPQKKRRILCDERLRTLFGKKTFPRIKVYDLLETHFLENQDESEEEGSSAEEDADEENGSFIISKERKTPIQQKKKIQEAPKSCFAAVTSENIKLVYLKRSLVQGLLKIQESFDDKVVGSFVRIKSDPYDFTQKNSHQLQQVTGVKKMSETVNAGMETYLQLTNWLRDVPISSLSDDDFTEKECEDLRERVKGGLLKRPTVVDLELKAHLLHEDITQHWIDREIRLLQRRIDHANEKGWRRELYEYLDKRKLLMTKTEQDRLLSEKPEVVAEELESEATPAPLGASEKNEEKSCSPEPDQINLDQTNLDQTKLSGENLEKVAEEPEKETMSSDAPKKVGGVTCFLGSNLREASDQSVPGKVIYVLAGENLKKVAEEPEKGTMLSDASKEVGGVACFLGSNLRGASELSVPEPVKEPIVIELSDDEDGAAGDCNELVSMVPHPCDEIWNYLDPQGAVQGPFPLSSLAHWYMSSYFHPSFRVWKTYEGQQQSVVLVDLLREYSII